jgi:hypothetical protein
MLVPVLMLLKIAWVSGPEKGRFGVAEFSSRSVWSGSRTAAPGLSAGECGLACGQWSFSGTHHCGFDDDQEFQMISRKR